jgi:SAM-dependent methyltransferase
MLVTMPLTPDELAAVSAQTLGHYERNARAFWDGTKDHDVTQNRAALLDALDGPGPFALLDLGCGPGRDLAYFRGLGHDSIGLDGCAAFVAMARAATGCEVWHQDFLALTLPPARFDGIFANASLFHVPTQELARVLCELRAALRTRGVLFTSNPRGESQEGWSGSRYSVHHDWDTWRGFVTAAGFTELHHYYRPPGRPCAEQPWLASVWRR